MSETAGGGFVDQFKKWSIPLFHFRKGEAEKKCKRILLPLPTKSAYPK